MSSFLQNLVNRSVGNQEAVQPRLPDRFEAPPNPKGSGQDLSTLEIPENVEPDIAESPRSMTASRNSGTLVPGPRGAANQLAPSSRPARTDYPSGVPLARTESPPEPDKSPRLAPGLGNVPRRSENQTKDDQGRLSLVPTPSRHMAPSQENATTQKGDRSIRGEMSYTEPSNRPEQTSRQETSKHIPLIEPIVRSLTDPREQILEQSEARVNLAASPKEPIPFSRQDPSQPTLTPMERQVVQVTIGRVDVRAVFAPPAQEPAKAGPTPAMSLEDYLRQRDGGKA